MAASATQFRVVLPRWVRAWLRRAAERGHLPFLLGCAAAVGILILLLLAGQVVQWVSALRIPLLDRWYRSLAPESRLVVYNVLFFGAIVFSVVAARRLLRSLPLRMLRVEGELIVAWAAEGASSIQRGDWIAYRLPAGFTEGQQAERVAVEQVLAMPGDRVRYTPSAVEVNGRRQRRLASMPGAGETVVPESHWLIWPVFVRGTLRPERMPASAVSRCGLVSHDRYLGQVTKPWLGRRRLVWLQAVEEGSAPDG